MSNTLTLKQIADRWGKSYSRVHTLIITEGRLSHFREGRTWYVPENEVIEFESKPRHWGRKRLSDD